MGCGETGVGLVVSVLHMTGDGGWGFVAVTSREASKDKGHTGWGMAFVRVRLGRDQLKKLFRRSVQLSVLGECLAPPFFSDSSSSLNSLRWCSVSLTGVSTTMWQYRSPG